MQADLPHTALQSVVSSSGLARQSVGFGHGEKPPLSEEGIGPAAMVLPSMSHPSFQVVMTAQYGAQTAPYKAIHDHEDTTMSVLEVVEPAFDHGIQPGNDALQAVRPRPAGHGADLGSERLEAFPTHDTASAFKAITEKGRNLVPSATLVSEQCHWAE